MDSLFKSLWTGRVGAAVLAIAVFIANSFGVTVDDALQSDIAGFVSQIGPLAVAGLAILSKMRESWRARTP